MRPGTSVRMMAARSSCRCARKSAICASVMRAQSCRTIAVSIIERAWNTWRASSTLGSATCAPRAGSSVTSLLPLNWFSACRTRVRETSKMSASFCSPSFVPGISRRSMIASVIAATMRSVLVAAASAFAGTAARRAGGVVRMTFRLAFMSGSKQGRAGS